MLELKACIVIVPLKNVSVKIYLVVYWRLVVDINVSRTRGSESPIIGIGTPASHTLSQVHFYLQTEVTRSSETSVLTRPTKCHFPEDGILHNAKVIVQNAFCL
jgi:hypothetical protein